MNKGYLKGAQSTLPSSRVDPSKHRYSNTGFIQCHHCQKVNWFSYWLLSAVKKLDGVKSTMTDTKLLPENYIAKL